jgi:hypothetical protein
LLIAVSYALLSARTEENAEIHPKIIQSVFTGIVMFDRQQFAVSPFADVRSSPFAR